MKFIKLLLVILVFNCCKKETTEKGICLVNMTYKSDKNVLAPPTIKVDFLDRSDLIEKKIKSESFKSIFFYGYEENQRNAIFMKYGNYEKKNDTISLYISTSYFESEKYHTWSTQKIESFLMKKGVGLVIENDTIRISKCK